ncbi:Bax inhibitor-1/YccA family protein [Thermodesulfobacteriota bacterium]
METMSLPRDQTQILINSFVRSVYNWMAVGLALTGFTAFYVYNTPSLFNLIVGNRLIFLGLILGELALVFTLSARVQRMKAFTATSVFLIYAVLNGATLSVIFLAYAASSIAKTFFVCAGTFAACSVYGMTTKRDLTSLGGFMAMGLIGIIIASVANMFFRSHVAGQVIAYIGVIVFVGLTAYDTQKLKHMALSQPAGLDDAVARKGAILGALALYLDFINLFLMLLRIFGSSRE